MFQFPSPRKKGNWVPAIAVFGLLLAGCSPPPVQPPEGLTHFKAIAVVYGRYLGRHGGRSPKNLEDFKTFVKKSSPDMLSRFGVESIEEFFLSPRDGEPLIFDFSNSTGSPGEQIVAYEQTGVDGKRVVVTSLGSVEVLDSESFHKRVP